MLCQYFVQHLKLEVFQKQFRFQCNFKWNLAWNLQLQQGWIPWMGDSLDTFIAYCICRQGCQMVPNLANIAKMHCFPKSLPNFFGNIFYCQNLPFFKYQLWQLTLTKFIKLIPKLQSVQLRIYVWIWSTAWEIAVVIVAFHLTTNH